MAGLRRWDGGGDDDGGGRGDGGLEAAFGGGNAAQRRRQRSAPVGPQLRPQLCTEKKCGLSGGWGGSISWFVGMGWGQGVCQCIPLTPLYTPYAVGTVRDIIFYNHRNSP